MNKNIIATLDIGTKNIKLVVGRFTNDGKLYILFSDTTNSIGISEGKISNPKELQKRISILIKEASEKLMQKIKDIYVTISSEESLVHMANAVYSKKVFSQISKNDLEALFQIIRNRVPTDYIETNILPVNFIVDNKKTNNPLNYEGRTIATNSMVVIAPIKQVSEYLNVIEECNLNICDISLDMIAESFSILNESDLNKKAAIINIGHSHTKVAIFKNGLIENYLSLNFGCMDLIIDISNKYEIGYDIAERLIKRFTNLYPTKANESFYFQSGKVVEEIKSFEFNSYIKDYMSNVFKNLRSEIFKISVDIGSFVFTGGFSQLNGLQKIAEDVFSRNIRMYDSNLVGARNAIYSTNVGMIHYAFQMNKYKNYIYQEKEIIEDTIDKFNEDFFDNEVNEESTLKRIFGKVIGKKLK